MPPILWLFLMPILASIIMLLLPTMPLRWAKSIAFAFSLIPLAMLIAGNTDWIGSQIQYPWLPALNIEFHLSIDSISLLFLFLTAIIIPISILASNVQQLAHPSLFFFLVLFLEGLLIGFFTAKDIALFTIFWEAMLLPLYFLINLAGGAQKQQAALKFLVYMIAGSALMVAAVLALYFVSSTSGVGTFNLDALAKGANAAPHAAWIAAIFLLAFAVKTPLFPFHAWLPDTYYQASTSGTILLSAILSKAGIYGFIRIGLGLFPAVMQQWSPILLSLAIIGVLYGGLAAWMQQDYKRLIAYSSFSHVNFVLAGLFVWDQTAHTGAILQAFNHGITIAGLFLVAGWLEQRLGSTSMNQASGLAKYMPMLCWLTLFFVLSSVALPGLNNFIGELLIFFGLFTYHPWLTATLGLSVILSVIYMLRWMQKMYFGPPNTQTAVHDITWKEWAIALTPCILILWVGLYPQPILTQIEPATESSQLAWTDREK